MFDALLIPTLQILIGFSVLVWGADRFVIGAAGTAYNFGVSPLIIGLTVVGLGTSAPEIIISTMASLYDKPSMAIGNAIGSNIANIALILGVTAIIAPITVRSRIISRELPLLMLITFLALVLLLDGNLSRLDGILLLSGLVVVMLWIVRQSSLDREDAIKDEIMDADIPQDLSTAKSLFWLLVGLFLLLGSSRILVIGATDVAKYFGVSDLIIGLTIIAIGTSLPELAASITATLKKMHDLSIGNIIGSNLFNILAVLSVPGIISPGLVPPDVLSRDMPVMVLLTLGLFATAYSYETQAGRINRIEGTLLFGSFVAYQCYLYVSS